MAVYEMAKVYIGQEPPFPARVRVVPHAVLKIGAGQSFLPPGVGYDLPPRNDLWNHSPDGFSWGYMGSGPTQLALAILADFTGDDKLAVSLRQEFKRKVIARMPQDQPFRMEASAVRTFLRDQGVGEW